MEKNYQNIILKLQTINLKFYEFLNKDNKDFISSKHILQILALVIYIKNNNQNSNLKNVTNGILTASDFKKNLIFNFQHINKIGKFLTKDELAFFTSLDIFEDLKKYSLDVNEIFLVDKDKLNLEFFIYYYEASLLKSDAKKNGVFYTEEKTVNEILENSLVKKIKSAKTLNKLLSITVLDPAMGCGIFLLKSFFLLTKKAETFLVNSSKLKELKKEIFLSCIYGIDIDKKALSLAKIIFSAFLDFQEINFDNNFICGNFLPFFDKLPPEFQKKLNAINFNSLKESKFDVIIGNPPYGLSRDEKIEPQELQILERQFKGLINGKFNKYMAFMAKGYLLLKKGGTLSFIVPNSWLGIRSGIVIRENLISRHHLKKIIIYQSLVFNNANVEAVVFVVQKRGGKNLKIEKKKLPKEKIISKFNISFDELENFKDFTIPTNFESENKKLFSKINNLTTISQRDDLFIPMITLQAYSVGKGNPLQTPNDVKNHIYHSIKKIDETYIPYLEPKDIERYKISWSKKYLKYGENLAENQPLSRFQGDRILIREITGKAPYAFISAITNETYLYNKSVLHIIKGTNGNLESLKALALILNSSFGGKVLKLKGRKFQRGLFPKIVKDDLLDFPLPKNFDKNISKLAYLFDEVINEKISQEKIDDIVNNIYEI